jgi:hypothetical protein
MTGTIPIIVIAASFILLSFTRIDSAWVMVGAAAIGLVAKLI